MYPLNKRFDSQPHTTNAHYPNSQGISSLDSSSPESQHLLLARAVASYDWDGIIPNRRTKGIAVERGTMLDICRVVNLEWCQVHDQGKCKYIPSAFLSITSVYEDRFKPYFMNLTQKSSEAVPTVTKKRSLKYLLGLFSPFLCSFPGSPSDLKRSPYGKPSIPPIPRPPFDREPYETTQDGSQVTVKTEYALTREQDIAIVFTLDMKPAHGSRLAGLTFEAILPGGYLISGITPERQEGPPTETLHCHSQIDMVGDAVHEFFPVPPNLAATSTTRGSVSHSVQYTRSTRSTISGGGVNTNRATWVATEDFESRSGLPSRMQLKLQLPTRVCPPTIKYMFSLEIEGSTSMDNDMAGTDSWQSPWIEESFL